MDAVLNATADPALRPNLYSWHEYIYENPTLTDTLFATTAAALAARNLSGTEQIITECVDTQLLR